MGKEKLFLWVFLVAVTMVLTGSSAMAEEFTVFDRPLTLHGYITQGVGFSPYDLNKYDTEKGLQSALMNLFIEGDYSITNNLKFYGSGMLTVDWAYQLNANKDEWHDKLFSKSKGVLNVDNKYWQLLKEAHVTWNPENFFFRVGKQIVAWGETDGFRLADQINPLDQRRGFADVEFETSIIPIWLIRAEYYLPKKPSWLQDLGFQFIFNPDADFIPNQSPRLGNDEGGIWAPNLLISGPFPQGDAHLGSPFRRTINEPSHFDPNFFEYGFRIKGVVQDAIITLNYFYGRNLDPVTLFAPIKSLVTLASDGRLIIHPFFDDKYARLHFVGATFSRDITSLKASFLGGVAPVLRLETLYAFQNTFATTLTNQLVKSNEFRGAVGIDWKVKIPLLNPRAYFFISPQFYYRRIVDYPGAEISFPEPLKKNNYQTTLLINTTYFHNKLTPSFFWMHDVDSKSDFIRLQLVYDYSDKWHFTLGGLLLSGDKRGQGFELFDNKDQIYLKISYKWG